VNKNAFKDPLYKVAQAHFEGKVLSEGRLKGLLELLILCKTEIIDLKPIGPKDCKSQNGPNVNQNLR
jgi:hypothetical protein